MFLFGSLFVSCCCSSSCCCWCCWLCLLLLLELASRTDSSSGLSDTLLRARPLEPCPRRTRALNAWLRSTLPGRCRWPRMGLRGWRHCWGRRAPCARSVSQRRSGERRTRSWYSTSRSLLPKASLLPRRRPRTPRGARTRRRARCARRAALGPKLGRLSDSHMLAACPPSPRSRAAWWSR